MTEGHDGETCGTWAYSVYKRFQKKGTQCCLEIQTIQSFGIAVMGLDIVCDPFLLLHR